MPSDVPRVPRPRRRRVVLWGIRLGLVGLIGLGGAFLYLHWLGLPDFMTARLQERLAAAGFIVQLGEVKLRRLETLVSQRLSFQPKATNTWPNVRITQAEVALDGKELKRGRVRMESVRVDDVQITWMLPSSNGPPHALTIDGLSGRLRILKEDHWIMTNLVGRWRDVEVHLSASITNASALREWRRDSVSPKAADWRGQLGHWLAKTEQMRVRAPAILEIELTGDAKEPENFRGAVHFAAAGLDWPGGTAQRPDLRVTMADHPAVSAERTLALMLRLDRWQTERESLTAPRLTAHWSGSLSDGRLRQLDAELRASLVEAFGSAAGPVLLSLTTVPADRIDLPLQTRVDLEAVGLRSPWANSPDIRLEAQLWHGSGWTNGWEAQGQLATRQVETAWGAATQARIEGHAKPRPVDRASATQEADWGFWQWLTPVELDWALDLEKVVSPKLDVPKVVSRGTWRPPYLGVRTLDANLYGGRLETSACLDVPSRVFQAEAAFDFDVHGAHLLLSTNTQRWIRQFTWATPPSVSGEVTVQLPAWTNQQPAWRDEVMPTVRLAGEFGGSNGAFRGISIASAQSHFTLTNSVWELPDLVVQQTDADVALHYTGNMSTHEYHWGVRGRANPSLLRPVFQEEVPARLFDELVFQDPIAADGEIWGRWHEPSTVGFRGYVAASNLVFRGEPCESVSAQLSFRDAALNFTNALVRRGQQEIRVPSGSLDMTERVVWVTNAVSTMDPDLVVKVIGPKIRAALKPYHFPKPPTVRINGRLPIVRTQDADVRFEIVGDTFQYWKLNVENVVGDVHWRGDSLSITNVQASFYGGQLAWWGQFDFSVPVGASLRFSGLANNADLHALAADMGRGTNRLEGSLDLRLDITDANSDDWRSWQGSGRTQLRDGFLWDIPIFGVFSPMLNAFVPGLGHSRISAGQASFQLNDGVIETRDLELKSPALRLRYVGNVDLQGHVDARVHAEILRDAWGIGKAVSLALWPISKAFEYRVGGTVSHPRSEPVYIPKPLLWPLHPFRNMKRWFAPEKLPELAPEADSILGPE